MLILSDPVSTDPEITVRIILVSDIIKNKFIALHYIDQRVRFFTDKFDIPESNSVASWISIPFLACNTIFSSTISFTFISGSPRMKYCFFSSVAINIADMKISETGVVSSTGFEFNFGQFSFFTCQRNRILAA